MFINPNRPAHRLPRLSGLDNFVGPTAAASASAMARLSRSIVPKGNFSALRERNYPYRQPTIGQCSQNQPRRRQSRRQQNQALQRSWSSAGKIPLRASSMKFASRKNHRNTLRSTKTCNAVSHVARQRTASAAFRIPIGDASPINPSQRQGHNRHRQVSDLTETSSSHTSISPKSQALGPATVLCPKAFLFARLRHAPSRSTRSTAFRMINCISHLTTANFTSTNASVTVTLFCDGPHGGGHCRRPRYHPCSPRFVHRAQQRRNRGRATRTLHAPLQFPSPGIAHPEHRVLDGSSRDNNAGSFLRGHEHPQMANNATILGNPIPPVYGNNPATH